MLYRTFLVACGVKRLACELFGPLISYYWRWMFDSSETYGNRWQSHFFLPVSRKRIYDISSISIWSRWSTCPLWFHTCASWKPYNDVLIIFGIRPDLENIHISNVWKVTKWEITRLQKARFTIFRWPQNGMFLTPMLYKMA